MKNYLLFFCFFVCTAVATAQEITVESDEDGYLIATDLRVNDEGSVKYERLTDSIEVADFLRNTLNGINAAIAKNQIELQNLEDQDRKMRRAYRDFTDEPYPQYVRKEYGNKYISQYFMRVGGEKSIIQINKDLTVETISGGKLSGAAKIISERMLSLDDFFEKGTSVMFVFENDTAVSLYDSQRVILRKTRPVPADERRRQ